MRQRCLLHLDSDGLSAWASQHGRLQALGRFPDDPGGHAGFAQFLAGHGGERFALLADLPEETLQSIEIPRLGRRDRATLIARRLARSFPDTPWRCAISLGRDRATPGSEQILLLALSAPRRLAPWLALLAQAEIGVARLQTASQFAAPLLKRLGRQATTALLVACHDHAFRITGLAAGHPRFSRQVPSDGASAAAAVAGEAGRLHRYLLEQRLHAHGQPLPVYVMAPAPLLAELAGHWPSGGELALQPLEFTASAARLGLSADEIDSRTIELHLLAHSPPAEGIPIAARRPSAAGFGRLLIAGGTAALAGALVFAGGQWQTSAEAWDEARRLDEERANLMIQHAAAQREQLPPPIDAASLRRLSETRAAISRLQHQPGPAYHRLGRALERLPAIEIERIDWKILPPSASTAEPPAQPSESTTVFGRLRDTPAEFAQFILALRADPGLELLIRQAPGPQSGIPWSPEFVVELKRILRP